jgi:hypothetical protein
MTLSIGGRYAKCRNYLNVMQSVVMPNVVMLSIIMVNVIMLSVVVLNLKQYSQHVNFFLYYEQAL